MTQPTALLFPGALGPASRLAARSPSSHNRQPWAVAWATGGTARRAAAAFLGRDETAADEYLILALDRRRRLTALPGHHLETLLGCGAHGRTLLRALAAQGWRTADLRVAEHGVRPFPDRIWPPSWTPLWVAAVRRSDDAEESLATLRALVRDRRTHRGAYRPEPPDRALLESLARPLRAGCPGAAPVTVRHLTALADRRALADLVARHAGRDVRHPRAWRETHGCLRWSEEQARAAGDGLPVGRVLGPLPPWRERLRRAALAPASMRVLGRLGYPGLLARRLAAQVRDETPALVALGFPAGPPGVAEALNGGARLCDYWLAATGAGLALHPLAVLVRHDDLRAEMQERLRLPGQTYLVGRLGRPLAPPPPAPRRFDACGYLTI
jgi:nitroreductase